MDDLDTICRRIQSFADGTETPYPSTTIPLDWGLILEEERARVQGKLTDICSDIWDLARHYRVSTEAKGHWNEERATLHRIIAILTERAE